MSEQGSAKLILGIQVSQKDGAFLSVCLHHLALGVEVEDVKDVSARVV